MKYLQALLTLLTLTTLQTQPNIVWIVCEDISPTLSMYEDSTARTPELDQLARESVIYDLAFAPVGVCAPTRSAIITGMEPTSIGTMHMRTGKDVTAWGKRKYAEAVEAFDLAGARLRQYAAVLPAAIKCFPEYLRQAGYYCTNNQKTDYQFAAPLTAWNENGPKAHWRNRSDKEQPFFAVFNTNLTHESKLWKHEDKALTVEPGTVPVPPYLPKTAAIQRTVARHYSNVELMDRYVGKLIAQLKADGLYEETIIFFYSDHGGPLPRQKREIYDTGLKVPLMVKLSKGERGGSREDRLVSFVDLAPTVLSLADQEIPDYLQGTAFLGDKAGEEREYVFGSSDRFDEYSDRSRTVRDARFRYVRHFLPELPKYKDVGYRKQVPGMPELLSLRDAGELAPEIADWFAAKPREELYDCLNDPHQLNNLVPTGRFTPELERFRSVLRENLMTRTDLGFIPEAQLINLMWPEGEQPKTDPPQVKRTGNKISLVSATEGAGSVYFVAEPESPQPDLTAKWELYTQPFEVPKGKIVYVVACRIGFADSEMLTIKSR